MNGKNILIGVAGGIAAYKTPNLVSMLVKQGYNVDVILTENAMNFITPNTFEALTKTDVSQTHLIDFIALRLNISVLLKRQM